MTATRSTPAGLGSESPVDRQPWWRYRMLWLVVGGPAIVVVASIVTGVIAAVGADPVLEHGDSSGQAVMDQDTGDLTPALQARNHAAKPKP